MLWKTQQMSDNFKIRYLDATGQQTDEANAVHRAAFVGVAELLISQ